MPAIADLTAPALARHANSVFIFSGRHQIGARLVYRALQLDPYEPGALRALSDILDYNGTQPLSGLVLEYALAPDSPLSEKDRAELDDLRFLAMWSWAFSKHKSASTTLDAAAFKDHSQFIVDHVGYREFLQPTLEQAVSLENAFLAARTLMGAMGQLLMHKTLGSAAPIEEIFHPDCFVETSVYAEWLQSDTGLLDALEAERQNFTVRQ